MIINSKAAGINPDTDVAAKLNTAIAEAPDGSTMFLEPGIYYLDSENCPKEIYYPTNTLAENQYKEGETPHLHTIGIHIKNKKDFTIEGEGAVFVARGLMTNAVISDSENITLKGIEFRAENPDVHEFRVTKPGSISVEFELDSESSYVCEDGKFYFTGKDYKTPFKNNTFSWGYYTHFSGSNDKRVYRSAHPLFGAVSFKEIADHKFSVKYLKPTKCELGDVISIYDVRRLECGIFVENSKNITIDSVKQRFNCSLAFVAQNTDTITIKNVDFCAAEGQVKKLVSYADFIQVCMCKGLVSVTDSRFAGAGDDVLNVHGTHFKIISAEENKIVCRFMHPESYGYLAFNPGDIIEYLDGATLSKTGEAKVLEAKLIDEYNVELIVDSIENAKPGLFIENITLCPDLYFARNTMSQIVTRGLLITTRGKVIVEDNNFINTVMPSILCSDDAKSWFESGPCKDVTIRGNIFNECDEAYIRILPENGNNTNYVHGDFVVENNTFKYNNGIEAKNTESVILRNNIYKAGKDNFLRCKNVNVAVDE